MCFLPLRYENSRALIYVYRPSRLRGDLGHRAAAELLGRCGYAPGSPARCLCQLRCRMAQGEGFPHEVGLFLGYPPEDVRGFMECRAKGFRCVGCWKVYGGRGKSPKALRLLQEVHGCVHGPARQGYAGGTAHRSRIITIQKGWK